jgi:uncharacterized protein YdiU (UPF0061 family)
MTQTKAIMKAGWNLENSYADLPKSFFSKVNPIPVRSPKLIVLNDSVAKTLGLNVSALESKDGVEVFAGNQLPEGSIPIAQAYAGHQFGHFAMLGDGRAVLLGEQMTSTGKRFDIQLKGSGKTPYSRGGDGRAALGPMLREYIMSEAMHALGIATTRSLAVVTTGEVVYRETPLAGAVLTRVASSHIRVATFEYVSRAGSLNDIEKLADYTLNRHFPNIDNENRYLFLLNEVIKRQAQLIAKWQLVGFIHGVMNTDNMAISGETIDYGPCAFMDTYDLSTVFSSIDMHGRYAYGNQPNIAAWNLARFAETLLPLLHQNQNEAIKLAQEAITGFTKLCYEYWLSGMRAKLGIFNEETQDQFIIEELLNLMQKYRVDYTNTFRALTFDLYGDTELFATEEFIKWQHNWQQRLGRQPQSKEASIELMRQNNPAVIPRNHRVEEAIEASVNHQDYSVMHQLIKILSHPFAHTVEQESYAEIPEQTAMPYRTFCGT